MGESQNGWSVDLTGNLQDRTPVHGVSFPNGVRRGDAATVLFYVADRFHREVEPLRPGWCWGWYVKTIEGSKATSNHASGTAIDLNAPNHPIGRRNTFTPAQEARIHAILGDCDRVVRWGGDYSGRPDEMHFEINANAARVAALADRIREGNDVLTPAQISEIGREVIEQLRVAAVDDDHGLGFQLRRVPWAYPLPVAGDADRMAIDVFVDMAARLERLEAAVAKLSEPLPS